MGKKEILKLFCADENHPRAYLRQPFIFEGNTVASNGHIMIVFDGKLDDYPDCQILNLAQLFEYKELAKDLDFITIDTSILKPNRGEKKQCEGCKGVGEEECRCCGSVTECAECDGEGVVDVAPNTSIHDGYRFNDYYLSIIDKIGGKIKRDLPNEKYVHFFEGADFWGLINGCIL